MPQAFRASVFHCLEDPGETERPGAVQYLEDGLLVVAGGRVVDLGPAAELLPALPDEVSVVDYRGKLIVPGFIDCHVHYSQLDIIAADGSKFLDCLANHAYPEEVRFADAVHAAEVADAFLDELLKNGTTTALVFTTVHPQAVDALFEAALVRDMRLIAGKVLMDRNCPDELADDAASAYSDSERLIRRWHGRDRLGYAITPRFAVTSSEQQLAAAGRLAAAYPDVWVHTHLAESRDEVEQITRLFPERRSYLDVYEHFGLLRKKSVFAHCLHLDDDDLAALAAGRGAAAFCPTSNLFLGSGLLDLRSLVAAGVPVGLATDVGGGTTLSMLRTMGEAYKVLHMRDQVLSGRRGFYLATLGAARALSLEHAIGNFETGREADFVVIEPGASVLSARRSERVSGIDELLFSLMFLGDDRHVAATYIQGRPAFTAA
jgi:guanine deaminase